MKKEEFSRIISNVPVFAPLFMLKRVPKWIIDKNIDLRPGEWVIVEGEDTIIPVRQGRCLPNKYTIGHSSLSFMGYTRIGKDGTVWGTMVSSDDVIVSLRGGNFGK